MNQKALDAVGWGKLVVALVVLGASFAAQVLGVLAVLSLGIPMSSQWFTIIPELAGAVVVVVAMQFMVGRSWMRFSWCDLAYACRFGWWSLLVTLIVMICTVSTYQHEGTPLLDDYVTRVALCALYCLAIGVLEEFTFRGLLMGGLLAAFGGTHKGVVRTVWLTSLIFGLAHVNFATDFAEPLLATQALLKVLQTGMYSILLCTIVLRTKHLWGASIFHALDDFMLLVPSMGLYSSSTLVDFVVEGTAGLYTIGFYLVLLVLYLPFVIKSLRELRRGQDVYRGPFMEAEVARVQRQATRGGWIMEQTPPRPANVQPAPSAEVPCAQPSVVAATALQERPPAPEGLEQPLPSTCAPLQDSEQL